MTLVTQAVNTYLPSTTQESPALGSKPGGSRLPYLSFVAYKEAIKDIQTLWANT